MPKPSARKPSAAELVAVIDLGSSAARLMIAEVCQGHWRVLETASQPVGLGRDVFINGRISRATMAQALQVLRGFRELMAGYPAGPVLAVGTSAVREAANRDLFLDEVHLRTGLEFRVIDGLEANRLTYLAVREALAEARPALGRRSALIMEIGGGSTELMLLRRGRMAGAHTLPLGTIRLAQEFAPSPTATFGNLLREDVRRTLRTLEQDLRLKEITQFVASAATRGWRRSALARRSRGSIQPSPRRRSWGWSAGSRG